MNSEGFAAHLGGGAPLNQAPTPGHALGQSCCGMTGLQHLRAWPKDLRMSVERAMQNQHPLLLPTWQVGRF